MKNHLAAMMAGALLILGGGLASLAAAQDGAPEVDLALALAVDCSFSVDETEYQLQMQGLGSALADPQVAEAIKNGATGRIAIAIYQWSDNESQGVVLPWTVIDASVDAEAIGRKVAALPRSIPQGGTAISSALIFGAALLILAPTAERQVIDLSTDGRNNLGGPAPNARNTVVARGITINGLAIATEWPTLDQYLEAQVTGGPGNFVIKAGGYDDFGAAMLKKLVKEITGPGLT